MALIPFQAEVSLLLEHRGFPLAPLVFKVLVFLEMNDLCGDPHGEHGRSGKFRSIKSLPAPSLPSRSTGCCPLLGVALNLQYCPFLVCCSCSLWCFL